MSKQLRNSLLLVLTALIWGMGFVSQSAGGDAIGPFAFNGLRNLIGGTVLLPVILFRDRTGLGHKPQTAEEKKLLFKAGALSGMALFVASSLQQLGITYGTPVGKAGFITACYILLVPIMGLFLKKRCGWNIWVGVFIMLLGLYLLCMDGSLAIEGSDYLIMLCAFVFAIQIMVVDKYAPIVDGVRMAAMQFFVVGIVSLPFSFVSDIGFGVENFGVWMGLLFTKEALIAVLYAGVFSSGVAYTLQIIAQNGLNPTLASMIMSLESVFSVIGDNMK